MSLQIGIVGLPNVGKSTLFNALTNANAAVANYPFTTIERNMGVAEVPDQRLWDIAAMVKPERVVPTTIEFVDIAGLVKGASQGEGLGNQFLGYIRNVDAVGMVVRCFHNAQAPHVMAEINPRADIEVVDLELLLADLDAVERRLEKIRSAAKARPKDYAAELDFLEELHHHLEAGQKAADLTVTDKEAEILRELNLLTAKPRFYIANVGEEDLPEGGELVKTVADAAALEGTEWVAICAQLEMDLADWPPEEAAAYRAETGSGESGLQKLVEAGYRLLNLITFFTTTGGKEVRAWTLLRGTQASQAAGKVHSDMERGFIRAEVVSYEKLMASGAFANAKQKGLLRLEGKEYVVQDGDV
ncbi:MAG: redox-regulated ATPase YchF, partial [Anaerolineales bacterium]|nr:redox-regulated ATPase YchF [Anaerolineales bacterium]